MRRFGYPVDGSTGELDPFALPLPKTSAPDGRGGMAIREGGVAVIASDVR